jgi:hypothetical protein
VSDVKNQPEGLPTSEERSDAELISAVRAGDVGSFGPLF